MFVLVDLVVCKGRESRVESRESRGEPTPNPSRMGGEMGRGIFATFYELTHLVDDGEVEVEEVLPFFFEEGTQVIDIVVEEGTLAVC